MRVDEDKTTLARRKRLKKFEQKQSHSAKSSTTENETSKLQTQTDATSHSKHQISSNNGTITNFTPERSLVGSNSSVLVDPSDLGGEVSRVERTLQLLRQHEERLELF